MSNHIIKKIWMETAPSGGIKVMFKIAGIILAIPADSFPVKKTKEGVLDFEVTKKFIADTLSNFLNELVLQELKDVDGLSYEVSTEYFPDSDSLFAPVVPSQAIYQFTSSKGPVFYELEENFQNIQISMPTVMAASAPGTTGSAYVNELVKAIPTLNTHREKCPVCHDNEDILRRVIVHVNDVHKKSREYIADWLETLSVDLTFKENKDAEDNI